MTRPKEKAQKPERKFGISGENRVAVMKVQEKSGEQQGNSNIVGVAGINSKRRKVP